MSTSKINSLDKIELRQEIFNWIQFAVRVVPYKAKLLHSRAYAFLYTYTISSNIFQVFIRKKPKVKLWSAGTQLVGT